MDIKESSLRHLHICGYQIEIGIYNEIKLD